MVVLGRSNQDGVSVTGEEVNNKSHRFSSKTSRRVTIHEVGVDGRMMPRLIFV
jgi:hypothetical protein